MSADLHTLSDAELSEVFAVEVAGWIKDSAHHERPVERGGMRLPNYFAKEPMTVWWHPSEPNSPGVYVAPPRFSTSVDALLPFIGVRNLQILRTLASSWNVWVASVGDVNAPTLSRALCIALILAARVELEKDRARQRSE